MKIRQKDCACEVPTHVPVLGDETSSKTAPKVVPGPIAVLPENHDDDFLGNSNSFRDAVTSAGGQLAPLDQNTRGLVWLSHKNTDDLASILATHPNLSWVQLPWAGVDAFSELISNASREDLVITSAKGSYAQPVAEHAFAMILALLRLFPRRIRATSWDGVPKGISLFGLNVTIVGAGGIARELIRELEPFRTNITVVRKSEGEVPGAQKTVTVDRLSEVLPTTDVLVLAAALTEGTRNLIGPKEFALLKHTTVLVNVARGALVDTDALIDALETDRLFGAATDVTTPEPLPDGHPLWSTKNMLITPHMADTPEMTWPLLSERISANVKAFVNGTQFVGVVDPEAGY